MPDTDTAASTTDDTSEADAFDSAAEALRTVTALKPVAVARNSVRSGWQVQDSNLRRRKPTDLQSAPIGRSGNLPWCD